MNGKESISKSLVPLIDLTMILMAWLLFAALKMKHYDGIEVELPKLGKDVAIVMQTKKSNYVTIDSSLQWFLNKETISKNGLKSYLKSNPKIEYVISVSKKVPFQEVLQLIEILSTTNVETVFEVETE
jgi:biopolymer transport protein ExbD